MESNSGNLNPLYKEEVMVVVVVREVTAVANWKTKLKQVLPAHVLYLQGIFFSFTYILRNVY